MMPDKENRLFIETDVATKNTLYKVNTVWGWKKTVMNRQRIRSYYRRIGVGTHTKFCMNCLNCILENVSY